MKLFSFLVGVILIFGAFTGCAPEMRPETLLIAGSTEMQPFIRALVEDFSKAEPSILINHAGGGSTPGIIALKREAIDVAAVSRSLTDEEDDEYTKSYLVARGGIAVVAHPDNPINNLSREQVINIFTGRINNWSQIGGQAAPIQLLSRKYGSKTRKGFQKIALAGGLVSRKALKAGAGEQLAGAVAADPDAIGYLDRSDMIRFGKKLKVLFIEDVGMNDHSILSGRYPFKRSFYFVTYGSPKPAAERFIHFVLGDRGRQILENNLVVRVR